MQPLLTSDVLERFTDARGDGGGALECSLDLKRSRTTVDIGRDSWSWQGRQFPYPDRCKDRTIYRWDGEQFEPLARYSASLVKLVPTQWGPPTFEIDGIKMLPTARVSPYEDAARKVNLIQPHGKIILDTCGGLGYFAAWCIAARAAQILSYEKNLDVIWLRNFNPWSPVSHASLTLTHADVLESIASLPADSVDAVLHDPPRFGIAGNLYSEDFYTHLARVTRRKGKLFHYTGTPNRIARGRDLSSEVTRRLQRAGFDATSNGDGLLAVKR